jgi:hypothetical protein
MNTFRHIRRPLLDGESVPPVRSLYQQLVGVPPPPIPEPEPCVQSAAEDDTEDDES